MSTLGNVPQVQGTGLRQFSGILSVTDVSGNNVATFSSGAAIIGSTIANTVVSLLGDTIISTPNATVLNTAGGASLSLANPLAVSQQTYIDFLYGASNVVLGRIRGDGGGNMIYSAYSGGIQQFRVGGDGGVAGSIEALRLAVDGEVLVANLGGGLQRVGYMGWPQHSLAAAYTTVATDIGFNMMSFVNSNIAVNVGSSFLYVIGATMMFSVAAAGSASITLNAAPGESIIGLNGLGGARTIGPAGNMVIMKVNSNWFIISGTNYSPL